VQPNTHAALREREGARAPGDAAADHRDLGTAVESPCRQLVARFLEPI